MRKLWNEGWEFVKLPLESAYGNMKCVEKRAVLLPHDWLIGQTDDLYESGDGWYVKTFLKAEADAETVLLDFDGVYMDADVLLNREIICTHRYGYTPFFVDLTGRLADGENEIAVHIRHQSPNSRWYSGAGIFRDVNLLLLPKRHMVPDGFQVNTEYKDGKWTLTVEAEIVGPGEEMPFCVLLDQSGNTVAEGTMTSDAIAWTLSDITPWGIENPYLYALTLTLGDQKEEISVGFRQTEFAPDRGFFLNGKPVKLKGVCLHHDLGLLGAAFHEKAAERQLRVMREMGVNAIRTSHNPPARQLLDLCDRMGFVVMDELYDMWELSKTPYDNARFFPDTYPQDVAAWVRRDRCHPCVILWSIGNEIYDMQASDRGQYWTKTLMDEVRKHDARHARVTFASNYMPWQGAQKCADITKLPGYNYAERYYATHHEQHPDWVIFGSETGSLLASRGIYHFPMKETILSEEDLQCSALLNTNTSWGAHDLRVMLTEDLNTPYSLGQFIWAGIDYIGEPTPYQTRCCYFGQTDTACFPKDAYYFYQAMWTDQPMIHIGIIWDWNEGQLIDVPVMTNGAEAELFLNSKSLGRKKVDLRDAEGSLPIWQVPYTPGELKAVAYDKAGKILCETVRSSFGEAKKIILSSEQTTLKAHCGDIAFIAVSVVDENGYPVENAANRLHAEVTGAGVLLGMDNGDSADADSYQVTSRRLFSGKLLIMAGANDAGEMRVKVTGNSLEPAEISFDVTESNAKEKRMFPALCKEKDTEEEIFIRRIDLKPLSEIALTPDHPSVSFRVSVHPENAKKQDIRFRATNAQGVDMPCVKVSQDGDTVTITALGDGNVYLRATANNGYPHTRVLSVIEVSAFGFGPMGLNPYEFIYGSLCDLREGDVGVGNDRGIAFARESESAVGFSNVDFGPAGSDEITVPIFALNGDLYRIKLWDGMPGQGGRFICDLPYQKLSIWNTYQPETWRLPDALTGVHTLAFSLDSKVHMQGFSFTRQSRALRYNRAVDCDELYGDSYQKDSDAVRKIGNNVTLSFHHMEFEKAGKMLLTLDGATELDINTVSLRVTNEQGEAAVSTCGFKQSKRGEHTFTVDVPGGLCDVSFVFLPGSSFDFYGFRFLPADAP
ncbi:MAG: DUF4982 domain-containing protein [Clostridia bacterium]|nr:DUF4982 domain-containing protein [Clostridia bacterium]